MINKKRDGHVHSPFCPHGTKDSFLQYLDVAINKGIEEISFTEHLPIPSGFMDDEFLKGCAPTIEVMDEYFNSLKKIKKQYEDKIKINIGAEVDFVEGYESSTRDILNKYGQLLDDSILSVHFVKFEDEYYCIDTIEGFEKLLEKLGSLEKVYDLYFESLLKSINSDLGKYKPKRIGHPTLVRIFNKKYPFKYENINFIEKVVQAIKNKDYEIDLNTAGLRKPYCLEVYPSGDFFEIAKKYNVKMVYGSDSHTAKDVGKDFY